MPVLLLIALACPRGGSTRAQATDADAVTLAFDLDEERAVAMFVYRDSVALARDVQPLCTLGASRGPAPSPRPAT